MPIIKEKNINIFENRFGGQGQVHMEHILDEQLYQNQVPLYAKITLKPGCSLGYHPHNGNSETYFILSGTGLYNNNGIVEPIAPGDTTFTPDGESHGMENTGKEDLVFMALIVNNK